MHWVYCATAPTYMQRDRPTDMPTVRHTDCAEHVTSIDAPRWATHHATTRAATVAITDSHRINAMHIATGTIEYDTSRRHRCGQHATPSAPRTCVHCADANDPTSPTNRLKTYEQTARHHTTSRRPPHVGGCLHEAPLGADQRR